MMKETVYKLTRADKTTYGGMLWGEGVTHTATGTGGLCTDGVIHSYRSPLLAALLNPIHANHSNPILWEASCPKITHDDGTKLGSKKLTTIRQVPMPTITYRQKVIFAILCAEAAIDLVDMPFEAKNHLKLWREWVAGYKAGNRAAYAAAARAYAAAYAAAARAYAADDAAYAAAYAARAAAYAADDAAYAADAAAYAAARAADYAARAAKLDLISLVEQAMEF